MANFETALAGMRRGEKWRRSHWGAAFYWWIDGEAFKGSDGVPRHIDDAFALATDWERYEEPKRNLSFYEAVKCQKVRVNFPDGTYEGGAWWELCRSSLGWYGNELVMFDLAERRGWKIEEAE